MNKIDTTSWKKFKVKDVFECKTTKALKETNISGNIAYVSRSSYNNGVSELVEAPSNYELMKKNCITIGAEGLYAFYQDEEFATGIKVYLLKHEKMNKYNALFIITILNQSIYKYSYGRARILDRIKEEKILLPINKDNKPDFEYMENYIKNLENKIHFKKIYTKNKKTNTKLDIKNWKFFKLFDKKNSNNSLFRVELSKGDLKQKDCLNGDIPLISASKYNNGVVKYVDDGGDGKANVFSSNTITADMFCNIFYQDSNFYSVSHGRVNILLPNFNMNKYIALFITTILKCEKYKFPYGRNLYKEEAQNIKIKLPTTKDGEPDFEYMEKFIKELPYGDLI